MTAIVHAGFVVAAAAADGTVDVWGPRLWFGVPAFVWHALNLAILGFIFWKLAAKAVPAGLRAKRERISREIHEATSLRDEMRTKFSAIEERMRTIDARMTQLLDEARTEAEAEKAKMVAEATALGNRIREEAKQIADQEIARARRELKDEQLARASELAEKILRGAVGKDDQARLSHEFLGKLEARPERKERPA